MNGIFITGTDTHVGKTYIATLLARHLLQQGINVVPRKPVESGCLRDGNELIPADAMALKTAANYSGSLAQVCPYRFEPPISPQRAAHLANQALMTEKVALACTRDIDIKKDFLLVEGAGGFYTPLCEDGLNADLAQALNLPVLLVAEDRVRLHQSGSTYCVRSINTRKLNLHAVILNQTEHYTHSPFMKNQDDLRDLLDCPIVTHAYKAEKIHPDILSELI